MSKRSKVVLIVGSFLVVCMTVFALLAPTLVEFGLYGRAKRPAFRGSVREGRPRSEVYEEKP